jgi:hypothetical protein
MRAPKATVKTFQDAEIAWHCVCAVKVMWNGRAHTLVSMVNLASAAGWTHTSGPIERIPWALTVGRDLGKGRSAQRFPAFS